MAQVYAINTSNGWWHIMRAPLPCNFGDGVLLKSVRKRELKKWLDIFSE